MIRIDIERKQKMILKITISGHANADVKGKDLVCAGVSCIAVGALNALSEQCPNCDLRMKKGFIEITNNLLSDHDAQVMLEMLRVQLVTMQESYKNYIQVTDQEV
ncbi:ribosomal-processing cysteine protease Prp [bacterium c-19]|nr:ribosomal-processing cysteine protease Prp [bacterium c-19]